MNITFEKITDYDEKINLKVQNHQTYYIESIEECLNEAKYYDKWQAHKIFVEKDLVAFGMYATFPEENNRVFLDRFFIDENYQGKGYFRQIMPVLIEKIKQEYNLNELYLSVYIDNAVAYKLYQEIGFKLTGEVDLNGEKVMVLKF